MPMIWLLTCRQLLNTRLGSFGIAPIAVTGNFDLETQLGIIKLYQRQAVTTTMLQVLTLTAGMARLLAPLPSTHPIGEGYEIYGNDVWAVKAAFIGHGYDLDLSHWIWDEECHEACANHQGY